MLQSINECLQDIHDQFEVLDQIRCDYDDVESAKLDLYMRVKKTGENNLIQINVSYLYWNEIFTMTTLLQDLCYRPYR